MQALLLAATWHKVTNISNQLFSSQSGQLQPRHLDIQKSFQKASKSLCFAALKAYGEGINQHPIHQETLPVPHRETRAEHSSNI